MSPDTPQAARDATPSSPETPMPPLDAVEPLRDLLRRHGLHALLLDAAASTCDVLPEDGADPVPWTWPNALDGLRRSPLALFVGRQGAFVATFADSSIKVSLQGRPPTLRAQTPGLARLATAPEGAAPLVGCTPHVPFGIPTDDQETETMARHRGLLVSAHRQALGTRAVAAWRRRTQAAIDAFRHNRVRGWSAVADGRCAFLLVSPPVSTGGDPPPCCRKIPRPPPAAASPWKPCARSARTVDGRVSCRLPTTWNKPLLHQKDKAKTGS